MRNQIIISNVEIRVPNYNGHDPYGRSSQVGELIAILQDSPGELVFEVRFAQPDNNGKFTGFYDAALWLE